MKIILQISLMKDALYDMVSKLFKTVPNVVMAVVIFIVGIIISKIVAKVVKKTLEKIGIDKIGEKLKYPFARLASNPFPLKLFALPIPYAIPSIPFEFAL